MPSNSKSRVCCNSVDVSLYAGDQHASEVADMSLDLLNGIRKFEVPHMKGVLVQIRIGLNTGPCVAGGAIRRSFKQFGDVYGAAHHCGIRVNKSFLYELRKESQLAS